VDLLSSPRTQTALVTPVVWLISRFGSWLFIRRNTKKWAHRPSVCVVATIIYNGGAPAFSCFSRSGILCSPFCSQRCIVAITLPSRRRRVREDGWRSVIYGFIFEFGSSLFECDCSRKSARRSDVCAPRGSAKVITLFAFPSPRRTQITTPSSAVSDSQHNRKNHYASRLFAGGGDAAIRVMQPWRTTRWGYRSRRRLSEVWWGTNGSSPLFFTELRPQIRPPSGPRLRDLNN
jgi:hypothetical protein